MEVAEERRTERGVEIREIPWTRSWEYGELIGFGEVVKSDVATQTKDGVTLTSEPKPSTPKMTSYIMH